MVWFDLVQGGDPLYAGINHKESCRGHNLPKWVRFFCKKTPAYSAEAWNIRFLHFKISFFGPRGVFFPTFLSFQNLLSLFKIYWVHYISGRSLQPNLFIFIKFTESLLSNTVHLESPVLEPARSHQINKRILNLLSYSVNSEKHLGPTFLAVLGG